MQQAKIMIVDDDPDITEAMAVVLESQDYSVTIAVNSAEARKKLAREKFDLIILDVMMDTLQEGFTFDRELKENPTYSGIPVLMITGVKEKTGLDFEAEAGDETWLPIDAFLDKPVKPQVLLEKVDSLLKKE